MEKVVYYCPNCGKTVSRLKGNKDNCSNCNGKIVQTPIDVKSCLMMKKQKSSQKYHLMECLNIVENH